MPLSVLPSCFKGIWRSVSGSASWDRRSDIEEPSSSRFPAGASAAPDILANFAMFEDTEGTMWPHIEEIWKFVLANHLLGMQKQNNTALFLDIKRSLVCLLVVTFWLTFVNLTFQTVGFRLSGSNSQAAIHCSCKAPPCQPCTCDILRCNRSLKIRCKLPRLWPIWVCRIVRTQHVFLLFWNGTMVFWDM